MGGGDDVVYMGKVVGTLHICITACTPIVRIHEHLFAYDVTPTFGFIQMLGWVVMCHATNQCDVCTTRYCAVKG